jgi:hypothetical protein
MALSASANPQSLTKAPKVGHILGALPRPQGRRSHHPGRGDNNPLEARGRFSQICGRGKGHAVLRREYLPHTASVCRVCGTQRGPGIPTTPACYPPAPLLSLTEWHARRRKLPNAPSQQPPGRKRSTQAHQTTQGRAQQGRAHNGHGVARGFQLAAIAHSRVRVGPCRDRTLSRPAGATTPLRRVPSGAAPVPKFGPWSGSQRRSTCTATSRLPSRKAAPRADIQ